MGEAFDNPQSLPAAAGASLGLPFLRKTEPPLMWRNLQDEIAWQDRERAKLQVTDDLSGFQDLSASERVAELYLGDFSASEMANCLAHVVHESTPGCSTYGLLRRAWWLARIVAHLGEPEDLELSTRLLRTTKKTCGEIALVWLRDRTCPCCVALRSRLEANRERK